MLSGVNAVSLPANTFTSSYQHYFINGILYFDSVDCFIRMRAAGSDNSTALSYKREVQVADAGSTAAAFSEGTSGAIGASRASGKINLEMFVYEPQLAVQTYVTFKTVRPPTNMQINNGAIIHNQSVSYDSMTFFLDTGNFNAGSKISVYGFNQ